MSLQSTGGLESMTALFGEYELRVVDDSPPTIVLKDAADALGYKDAYRLKRSIKDKYCAHHKVRDTTGREQDMLCVTRPGLSQLLASLRPRGTKTRKVERFQDWLYEDLLESVYNTQTTAHQTIDHVLDEIEDIIFDYGVDVDRGYICLPEFACKVMAYRETRYLRDRFKCEGFEIHKHTFPYAGYRNAVTSPDFYDMLDYLPPNKGSIRRFIDLKRNHSTRQERTFPSPGRDEIVWEVTTEVIRRLGPRR